MDRLLCLQKSPGENTEMGSHFFSRGSSRPRDQTWVSCIAGGFFTIWATREAHRAVCPPEMVNERLSRESHAGQWEGWPTQETNYVHKSLGQILLIPCPFASSGESLSRVQLFVIPWTAALQASLSITNSQSSPKLMSIDSVMLSNHLILCHPILLLPSIFPNIRVLSNESALHTGWPKYWSFSISPSSDYSGLISFRID